MVIGKNVMCVKCHKMSYKKTKEDIITRTIKKVTKKKSQPKCMKTAISLEDFSVYLTCNKWTCEYCRKVKATDELKKLNRLTLKYNKSSTIIITLHKKERLTEKDFTKEVSRLLKKINYHSNKTTCNCKNCRGTHAIKTEGRVKYYYVLEYQKRGALHMHGLLFNVKYLCFNWLMKNWDGGGYLAKYKKGSYGRYMLKYMIKQRQHDIDKQFGLKRKVYHSKKIIDNIKEAAPKCEHEYQELGETKMTKTNMTLKNIPKLSFKPKIINWRSKCLKQV